MDRHLAIMHHLKMETERENYRKLKTSIIRVVTQGELSRADSQRSSRGNTRTPGRASRIDARRASAGVLSSNLPDDHQQLVNKKASYSSATLNVGGDNFLLPPQRRLSGVSLLDRSTNSFPTVSDDGSLSSDQGIVMVVDEKGVTVPGITPSTRTSPPIPHIRQQPPSHPSSPSIEDKQVRFTFQRNDLEEITPESTGANLDVPT